MSQTCRRCVCVLGLNDDTWHNVSVTVDLLTALLTVDVTSASSKEHRLMTLMTSEITSPADESWKPVTSVISLGGAIVSYLHYSFVVYTTALCLAQLSELIVSPVRNCLSVCLSVNQSN